MILYNDNDNYCCKVLRTRVNDGQLPSGVVDPRPIQELEPDLLRAFRQIHLFAGIGGFPLGLRWAGVPLDWSILTGGFPCQDISIAGKGAGIDGDRSGLWSEMLRCIRMARPQIVCVENVAALLVRGLDRVVRQLAEIGYDCEWHCIPASYVGAPHRRDRVWIVGHAVDLRQLQPQGCEPDKRRRTGDTGATVADAAGCVCDGEFRGQRPKVRPERYGEAVPDTDSTGLEGCGAEHGLPETGEEKQVIGCCDDLHDANRSSGHERRGAASRPRGHHRVTGGRIGGDESNHNWATEPNVGRVAHGVPARVDRLKGLGNAIVPQVAQYIGRHLLERWRGADEINRDRAASTMEADG